MLINILYLIIGVALTLVWIKVIKQKTPLNFQEFVKDKFWLIITGSLIVAIGYLYFYLPQVFEWLAVEFWGVPSSTITEDGKTKVLQLTDLGPLGDIYGSLNTLFTSATLAFVIYATLLQRQANHDAREAMAKQLRQARHATRKQLRQSQLSTKRQLKLAQAAHDAQRKESQHTIFSNAFYSLLNYKRDLFGTIKFNKILEDEYGTKYLGESMSMLEIMRYLSYHFTIELLNDKPANLISDNVKDLRNTFYDYGAENFNGSMNTIISYFLIYVSIWELISNSNLEEKERDVFKKILRNSMSQDEQFVLFWLTPMFPEFKNTLVNSEIFDQFQLEDKIKAFTLKYYDSSYFANIDWKLLFENNNKPQPKLG